MTETKRAARSVADLQRGLILASVEIAVPPEQVFRALTDPQAIVQWWGSPEQYQTTDWTSDLRVGGRWRAAGRGADGHEFTVQGEFLEIEPPHKLVQTWRPDWDGGHTTTLTYRLDPIEGGTRLTVRHEGFGERRESCRSHALGWEHVLGWLDGYLRHAAQGGDTRKYFVCKLMPPRASFAFDMNEQERDAMQRHAAYLRSLLARGHAIVFGPVADPAGPYGLCVMAVRDEAEVRALTQDDPVIKAGLGLRYEFLPMLAAVHA